MSWSFWRTHWWCSSALWLAPVALNTAGGNVANNMNKDGDDGNGGTGGSNGKCENDGHKETGGQPGEGRPLQPDNFAELKGAGEPSSGQRRREGHQQRRLPFTDSTSIKGFHHYQGLPPPSRDPSRNQSRDPSRHPTTSANSRNDSRARPGKLPMLVALVALGI